MKKKFGIGTVVLAGLFIQMGISWHSKDITPKLEIIEDVPSLNQARIGALGDEQFYFRILALNMQNMGDTFGRFTALKDYDYGKLFKWFGLLDELDYRSHFTPAIASYYYSNTQKTEDNEYIVNYLEAHYDKQPTEKWWWLGQAIYIANHKLNNKERAIKMAYKLSNTPNAKLPRWAQQMPAILLRDAGRREEALEIMKELAEKYDDYSQSELNYMNYFIRQMLGYEKEQISKEHVKPEIELEGESPSAS
jgi:hypothetical protein